MMKTYRVAQGLGCWTSVAEAIGESTDWVRSVYTGEVTAPLGMWRKIEKALDELTLGRNAITSSTGKE